MIPPGDRGGARFREQAARLSRKRRFDSDLGQSGGPRLDGRARRAAARADGRERVRRRRHRAARGRARLRLSRAPSLERAARSRARPRAGEFRISTTTAISIRRSQAAIELVRDRRGHRSGGRGSAAGRRGGAMSEGHPDWLVVRQGAAPLIVSIPHAGHRTRANSSRGSSIPGSRARTPTGASTNSTISSRRSDATLVRTTLSRSIIDVNRDPSGASLYPGQATTELCPTTTFDGEPLYRPGEAPDEAGVADRLRLAFEPYHNALHAEIVRLREHFPRVALFDAHSIRSRIPRLFEGELPVFNLGTNSGASCSPALREAVGAALAASGRSSVVDGRFKGGWITRQLRRARRGRRGAAARTRLPRLYGRARAPRPGQLAAADRRCARERHARDDPEGSRNYPRRTAQVMRAPHCHSRRTRSGRSGIRLTPSRRSSLLDSRSRPAVCRE